VREEGLPRAAPPGLVEPVAVQSWVARSPVVQAALALLAAEAAGHR